MNQFFNPLSCHPSTATLVFGAMGPFAHWQGFVCLRADPCDLADWVCCRLVAAASPDVVKLLREEMVRVGDEWLEGGRPICLEAMVFTASKPTT